ncbi:MAG TPA: agmatinase family protein [Edaphocola sp.]|nr:agmatinase family protein [Edaphocola sp.]
MKQFEDFNPNEIGLINNNIFGLPSTEENSQLIIIPCPWEVTVSYRAGTAKGPEQIFEASKQIDLYDEDGLDNWKKGYYMLPIDKAIESKSSYLRSCSELIIAALMEGTVIEKNDQLCEKIKEVNDGGEYFKNWLKDKTLEYLNKNKTVVMIGGDHSTPLGYIQALATKNKSFGILHIDAHADLREAYENFKYSHASIMYNVLKEVPEVSKLVQVGIRDFCDEEKKRIESDPKIKTFFNQHLKERMYEGETWKQIVEDIISNLPDNIYISFDIDGLDPKLCPNTGTPVPGGFEIEQVFYLFKKIKQSGKAIIGFDINEVSSGEEFMDTIDPVVGARILYKMCNILMSQNN